MAMLNGWRFWVLIALLVLFPIVVRPWWLLILSATAYALLIWLLMPRRGSK